MIRLVKQDWDIKKFEKNLYCINVEHSIKLIEKKYGIYYKYESSHNMMPYLKSCYHNCMEEFALERNKTILSKFRTPKSLQRTIVSLYTLALGNGILKEIRIRNKFLHLPPENLFMPIRNRRKMKSRLFRCNPVLFCINDNESAKDEDRTKLKSFLEEMFPQAAPWELLNKN